MPDSDRGCRDTNFDQTRQKRCSESYLHRNEGNTFGTGEGTGGDGPGVDHRD